jgi:hypothetical protein
VTSLRIFIVLYATLTAAGIAGWLHGRYDSEWVGAADVVLLFSWLALVRVAGRLR